MAAIFELMYVTEKLTERITAPIRFPGGRPRSRKLPRGQGSDVEELAVLGEGSVGFVGKNFLGEDLTKLNTFLIEGIDIPYKALEHYLVLKVRKKSTQRLRIKLITNDNT